jgi:hypothetical protein
LRKTTSLKIEEEIWKKLKIKCITLGKDISEHLEELIKNDLKEKK